MRPLYHFYSGERLLGNFYNNLNDLSMAQLSIEPVLYRSKGGHFTTSVKNTLPTGWDVYVNDITTLASFYWQGSDTILLFSMGQRKVIHYMVLEAFSFGCFANSV